MERSLIPEKLLAPSLPAVYLPRPRLERLWGERSRHRLLLVTAGAGYGKTSFLVERAGREERDVLWYRVDEGDEHLPYFAAHLFELLGSVAPSPPADTSTADPGYPRRILAAAVAGLRTRGSAILIFDDAQYLTGCPEILQILERLVSYLPATTTIVLSAREPLPIGGMRGRTTGQAVAIEARDLAFRTDEIAALFALRHPGIRLRPEQGRRILAATEGWAAGLEIFLQALKSATAVSIDRTLDHFGAAGAGWFDYFAEEVLVRLDDRTRDFLERTSVLPRLDPAACDRLLGQAGSGEILESLARRNLFTLRETADRPVYRYHHIFHRFLQTRLEGRMSSVEMQRLRRRAARELLREDDAAGALELIAQTGDVEGSLRIVGLRGESLLVSGRRESVERALAIIPPGRLCADPEALFVLARLHDDAGRWDDAERTYRRILKLGPGKARRVEVLSILAQLVSRRGDYGRAMAICLEGLRERRFGTTKAQGRLLWTLGVAACELGDLEEGEKRLEEARALFRRRGETLGEAQVDYLLAANVYLARGEFGPGRETARRALARLQGLGDPRRTCQCLGVLAWISVLAGDVDEARDAAAEARRLSEAIGFPQAESMALHVLGRCALLGGDLARARVLLEGARRLGDALSESDARIVTRLLLCECALASGDRRSAARLGEAALALARESRDPLQEAQAGTLLGLALRNADPAAARSHWRRAERTCRRLGALHDLHRLLLLRLAEESLPDTKRRCLEAELLAGTARLEHDPLFLVYEPQRAGRVLARALADGIEPDRAADLLCRLGERAVPELLSLSREANEDVRLRAVDLLAQAGGAPAQAGLRRIARHEPARASAKRARAELERIPPVPLRLHTLGTFRVQVGEREIPAERWRSGRARRLLQFLLVHRFRWVDGEELIEALWPETDPEKTRGNLWQAVYRLRRILEPDLHANRESCYVRVTETRYRLQPGDGSYYDAAAFEDTIHEADRLAASARPRAAQARYRAALELYKGEFLAESPYEEFLVPAREHLREQFVQASLRLTGMLVAGRHWGEVVPLCRRVLRESPYEEETYLHLMEALHQLGHRHEALEAHQMFETRIVGELGLLRSPRMQDLAERIRHGAGRR